MRLAYCIVMIILLCTYIAVEERGIRIAKEEAIDSAIGWHYEVIPTDALSKCEPFCYPMPLTDFYIKANKMEVIGNIFDNPELLEERKNENAHNSKTGN